MMLMKQGIVSDDTGLQLAASLMHIVEYKQIFLDAEDAVRKRST